MTEIETAAEKAVSALLAAPIILVLIGPRWSFISDFMMPVLRGTLKREIIKYNSNQQSLELRNGSRVISISSQSPNDFYHLQGLMVDKIWLHGYNTLTALQREFLSYHLRNGGEEGNLIRTYG